MEMEHLERLWELLALGAIGERLGECVTGIRVADKVRHEQRIIDQPALTSPHVAEH